VRLSRLLLFAAAAVLALATTAVATAVRAPVEDGTLSVRDGRGVIGLRMKGGVIGRFARGKVTVTEAVDDEASTVVVRGAERSWNPTGTERTTVYSGTNVRFRVSADKRVVVKIDAVKINLSAVGRGDGWLNGRGDPEEGIYFDGSYSLNGDAYKSLPDERSRFDLAAPPPSG
jgi:hypothetical protein